MPEAIDWDSAIRAMLHAKEQAKSGRRIGSFDCPKCGKMLIWAVGGNGHTRGKCATPECVAWIE